MYPYDSFSLLNWKRCLKCQNGKQCISSIVFETFCNKQKHSCIKRIAMLTKCISIGFLFWISRQRLSSLAKLFFYFIFVLFYLMCKSKNKSQWSNTGENVSSIYEHVIFGERNNCSINPPLPSFAYPGEILVYQSRQQRVCLNKMLYIYQP